MERIQKTKTESTKQEVAEEESTPQKRDKKIQEDKAHADDLLDEIDSLLEQNAETFVKEYIQRGGQ